MKQNQTSSDPVFEQAAEWLSRLDANNSDTGGRWSDPEFLDWMAHSEQHRLAFAEASELWFGAAEVVPAMAAGEAPTSTNPRLIAQPHSLAMGVRWRWAAAALLLLAAVLLPNWTWMWQRAQSDLATPRGVVQQTTLPDGSTVMLAGRSAVRRLDGERGLELLGGSIVLEVAEDPGRPFRVVFEDGEAVVLGTRFGVSSRNGEARVGVFSGRVRVRTASKAQDLTGGEQVRITGANLMSDSRSPDESFSWSQGRLLVRDSTLQQVIARLQPFSAKRIWLLSPEPDIHLSAVLRLDDMDRALSTLAREAGLELTSAGPVYILR